MSDQSTVLGLPLIMPAQAQKHVTHNEALRVLDAIVQLGVLSRSLAEPPETPVDGSRWIVPAAASGAWAGAEGKIALREYGYWSFIDPQAGWQAHVADENVMLAYDGADWGLAHLGDARADRLGIATTPDAVNRLAVASEATLLTHAGAGHQVKINKATEGDTASLLFQSDWTGHAEMGLAGDNQFSIKVSPDGAVWTSALIADATSGTITMLGAHYADGTASAPAIGFSSEPDLGLFRAEASALAVSVGGTERARFTPDGMVVSGLVTGTAVTQSDSDTTDGRLIKVGDYGLGTASQERGRLVSAMELPDLPGGDGAFQSGVRFLLLGRANSNDFKINGDIRYGRLPTTTTHSNHGRIELFSHKSGTLRYTSALNRIATQFATRRVRIVQLTYDGESWIALESFGTNNFPLLRAGIVFSGFIAGEEIQWVNESAVTDVADPVTGVAALEFNNAEIYHHNNALGTVSETGGLPAGALFQRALNANGAFERRASGWMDCTRTDLSAASVSASSGALFESADITWTFPSAFVAGTKPVVHVTGEHADVVGVSLVSISHSAVTFRVRAVASIAGSVALHAHALGRWSTMT